MPVPASSRPSPPEASSAAISAASSTWPGRSAKPGSARARAPSRAKAARQSPAAQGKVAGRPSAETAVGPAPGGAPAFWTAAPEGLAPAEGVEHRQGLPGGRLEQAAFVAAERRRAAAQGAQQGGGDLGVGQRAMRRLAELERRRHRGEAVAVDVGVEQKRGMERVEGPGTPRRCAAARRARAEHAQVEGDVLTDDEGVAGQLAQLVVDLGERRGSGQVVGRDAGETGDLQGQRVGGNGQADPGARDLQVGVDARRRCRSRGRGPGRARWSRCRRRRAGRADGACGEPTTAASRGDRHGGWTFPRVAAVRARRWLGVFDSMGRAAFTHGLRGQRPRGRGP